VSVSSVDGFEITHKLHRNVQLEAFLKTLPSGSVDHVDINDSRPYLIAVVEVTSKPGSDGKQEKPSPQAFQTIFHGKDELVKKWEPAKGNKSGRWSAVFVLPDSISRAETSLVDNGSP